MPSSLLDRLKSHGGTDLRARDLAGGEAIDSVLRDLEWLFNASSPLGSTPPAVLARYPRVAASVLNYGLRNAFGQVLHNVTQIERQVTFALAKFEPRLAVNNQSVRLSHEGQLVEIEIEGTLLTNQASQSLCIHTDLRTSNSKLDSHG
jgi:type VI secretion system lysozyme-like protein